MTETIVITERHVQSGDDRLLFIALAALFACDAWLLLDALAATSTRGVPGIAVDRFVIVCGTAALIAMVLNHRRSGRFDDRRAALLGAVCGLMFFARSVGCALIDPGNIEWLMRGDWAEHYASWESFRSAPWTWPLGANMNLWYPVGTSLVFTDSLPLLAIPAKALRTWLPDPFQYIGIVLAINFILQGVFGALLVRRAKADFAATLAGCLLFLFAPILIWRIGHDTLTAQWLILAALWLYFRDIGERNFAHELTPWCVIAIIAALVHPYFPPMIMSIALAYWLRRTRIDRARSSRQSVFAVVAMLTSIAAAWWMSGAFVLRSRDASGGIAMGIYTSNLLTFFNPAGFSQLFPPIPGVPPEQWEGAAYLGLGILCLMLIVSSEMVVRRHRLEWLRAHWPLAIAAIATASFAVSTTAMLGPFKLTQWTIQLPLIEGYRASGRFIWIAFYLVLALVVWRTVRAFPRLGCWLLIGAVALQMWDFRTVHLHFAGLRSGYGWPEPERALVDRQWDEKMSRHRHLTMLPPIACGKQAGPYLPFELLAARHAATFNTGYLGRWNAVATERYCNELRQDVDAEKYSDDQLYVIGQDLNDAIQHVASLKCELLDGYTVCETREQNVDGS